MATRPDPAREALRRLTTMAMQHVTAPAARLLYFSSARSGPARRVEAFVDQVMQERQNHQAFQRYTIDVESQPDLAERFHVNVVPTILVIDDRKVVRRIEGRVSVPELRRQLSPWLR